MVRDECRNAKDRKGGDFSNLPLESAVAREEKSLVNAGYDGSIRFAIPCFTDVVIPTKGRNLLVAGTAAPQATSRFLNGQRPFRNDKKFLISC